MRNLSVPPVMFCPSRVPVVMIISLVTTPILGANEVLIVDGIVPAMVELALTLSVIFCVASVFDPTVTD